MVESGIVYLVGAGPGNPHLLTRRGEEVLGRADFLAYDAALPPRLLGLCPGGCERIEADKARAAGVRSAMVEGAKEGKTAVRLYRDDPFLSGQGVEDAKALARAGVAFEVVPGIPHALAASAFAGIPLLHEGLADRFTVVNANPAGGGALDFEALAKNGGTLVFQGEAESVPRLIGSLLAGGFSPDLDLSVILEGGLPLQRVIEGNLGGMARAVKETPLHGSAVIVAGKVNRLRGELGWLEERPLHGRRILVTRPREQAGEFARHLEDAGAEVGECPAIRIAAPQDWGPLDAAVAKLDSYDWIIFTSANGVRFFAERLRDAGRDARAFGKGARIVAIGPGTGNALEEHLRLRSDVLPETYVAEGVLEALAGEEIRGKRVLIPRALEAREVLPETLREREAAVEVVAAYRTLCAEDQEADSLRRDLAENRWDMITFTSSSTVRNFVDMMGAGDSGEGSGRGRVEASLASIGPVTSATLREFGLAPNVEAKDSTVQGLARAIANFYRGAAPAAEKRATVPSAERHGRRYGHG